MVEKLRCWGRQTELGRVGVSSRKGAGKRYEQTPSMWARVGIPGEGHDRDCRLHSAPSVLGEVKGWVVGRGQLHLTPLLQLFRYLIQPVNKHLFLDTNLFQK